MPQEAENVNKATMVLAAAALSITLIPAALAAEGVQGIDEASRRQPGADHADAGGLPPMPMTTAADGSPTLTA